MNVKLAERTREHVKINWEKTKALEIRALIPIMDNTLEEALQLFEETLLPGAKSFGKIIIADDNYVGDIWCYGIDEEDEKMAMLSFLIFDEEMRGKGGGWAAMKQFIPLVFENYKIEKIGAFTYEDNGASIGLLKKAGFHEIERFVEDSKASIYFELEKSKQKVDN